MSHRADQYTVSILGIDQDLRDVLAIFESDVGPVLAVVGGLVNAIADRDAVSNPTLTAAHPHRFRVRWINRHRADRLHTLAIKHRLVSRPTIHRLPHTAAGRADEDSDAAVLFH